MNKTSAVRGKNWKWFSKPRPGHLVQFYQSDTTLLQPLTEYIGSGLSKSDICVVIATPSHSKTLDDQLLKKYGIVGSTARHSGQYITLDAAETLEKFMVDDTPDRDRFFATVGALIEKSAQKGKTIRAYGEMVALLWKAGNKNAVIQLENLWNELADMYDVCLYCAYPELHFVMDGSARGEIGECHDLVVSGSAAA